MARNFNCPETEEPCTSPHCRRDRCVDREIGRLRIANEEAQKQHFDELVKAGKTLTGRPEDYGL